MDDWPYIVSLKVQNPITMSSFRLRPRFRHTTDSDFESIQMAISTEAKKEGFGFELDIRDDHITVRIPEKERHFWSPQLDLSFEQEDASTQIRGHYGPNSNTWVLFTYGYAMLAILFFFAGIWVASKLTLHKPAPEAWLLVLFVALAFVLYLIAQFGQKIGAEQMYRLHFFYQKAMGGKIRIE